ncbi:beta-xylosidase [Streptomyces achromogenes]|uniref:Beta-xylosidase n=1 Tax=Streptomyces achromogenes TaxID=67255 RepID=A0ABU0PTJ6_STRAH|nr:family 43 glycosylhydrolase [Streptomyces achromogenes]MDQ0681266.1 beta-xylosidase [Streptomyces achromogenes]MDQ0828414.1 beta-xylosidase [Streptomyces achromogenes]
MSPGVLPSSRAAAATPPAGTWGDQGDGSYVNPVLPGDFGDWDCIRVGTDYYGITSTFGYSPGMAVLHSKDLVNWRTLGSVADDVTRIGPLLNWDRMNRYGRGVRAGAIRYHAGRYWTAVNGSQGPAGDWADDMKKPSSGVLKYTHRPRPAVRAAYLERSSRSAAERGPI